MSEQRCPTCGSVVKVAGDPSEGTMYYEPLPGLEGREAWYQQALRAIEGPSDDWLWMEPYRAAGGGYEGLQAIASFALSSVPDGEGE